MEAAWRVGRGDLGLETAPPKTGPRQAFTSSGE